jgi:HEAT repeat protein
VTRTTDAALKKALAEVHDVRAAPSTPEARNALTRALASPSSFVVEAAARVVAEHELGDHTSELREAFARFADEREKDPGCKAKTSVVEALVRLRVDADDVYLRAIHLRPRPVDTAVALRAGAAAGLAQGGNPGAAVEIAELLADAEWPARAGAARALALCGQAAAEPLLRYKVRTGDPEPQVLGECLRALLAVNPDALPFVAKLLHEEDAALAEQAALAIGESRLEAAFEALSGFVAAEPLRERRNVALVAIALLRRDVALDYLIGHVAGSDVATAKAAVEALAIYRHDSRVRERVIAAARERDDASFLREVERWMP